MTAIYDKILGKLRDDDDIAILKDVVDRKQDLLVSGQNIKTVNGQSILGAGNLVVDGHFKGWFDTLEALQTSHPSPQVGDYAYVKGTETTDPAAIYECNTAGRWSNSGRTADTSKVQTFADGQEVNEVHIVNNLTTGGTENVLSAEQGKKIVSEYTKNLFDPNYLISIAGWTETDGVYSGNIGSLHQNFNGTGKNYPFKATFKANTAYTFSLDAKRESSTTGYGLQVVIWYTDGTRRTITFYNTDDSYTHKNITISSSKTIDRVCFTYGSNPGTWYIKNFQVEEGTSETNYLPYVTAVDSAARNSCSENNSYIQSVDDYAKKTTTDIGLVEYSFYVDKTAHLSVEDIWEVNYKSGTVLRGKLSAGTAVCDGYNVQYILRNNLNEEIGSGRITLGTEFEICVNYDFKYIGFYIYKITQYGTFDVTLRMNYITEIENLSSVISEIPIGNIVGYGSINLQSKFKEEFITMPKSIRQTIFDTDVYSVGVQSHTIYNNQYVLYLVNATNKNDSLIQKSCIVIVDITTKTKLGEFEITTDYTRFHGNNITLGQKYDETDTLPLVYADCFYDGGGCIVCRIANDFSSYTQIQEINYIGSNHFQNAAGIDWIVDENYIWVYGGNWDSSSQWCEFAKFALPNINQSIVELSDTDIIGNSFIKNDLRITQGAFIKNGKLYIALGYEVGREYIKVVDLTTHVTETIIPLNYEPEGITEYNGKVCVGNPVYNLYLYSDAF